MGTPCLEVDVLIDYLAGEVSPARGAGINTHLEQCDKCRKAMAGLIEARKGSVTEPVNQDRSGKTALTTALVPAGPPPPDVGTVLASRFELTGKLGEGGMGIVFLAKDLRLGVPVALKLLSPRLADNPASTQTLQNEIVVARRITHRNVCRVYDFGTSGPHVFFTMELVSGQPLDVKLQHRLPLREASRLFSEIAAGLAAAHAEGVVHRDLKPGNVVLDETGTAKLMDFGLASPAAAADSPSGDPSERVGTPHYWAPEQARGEAPQPTADVYSAGVIGFRLLTGLPSSAARDPAKRTAIPRRFRSIIAQCLSDDPHARPANGAALLAAIERARRLPQRIAAATLGLALAAGLTGVGVHSLAARTHSARAQAAIESLMEGHVETAGIELDKLVLDDVNSPSALLGAAIAKWWREQPWAYIDAACDQAIAAQQPPGRELFLRALKPLARQRWAEALAILDRAAPDEPEPLVAYGRFEVLYHQGRPREAFGIYQALLEKLPRFRLGFEHVLDYAIATLDPQALDYAASRSKWMREDLAFAPWAVRIALARGELDDAMTLATRTAARSAEDSSDFLLLKSLHVRLLLVKSDLPAAEAELDTMPALAPPGPLDQLGYAMAIGDMDRLAPLLASLDEDLTRGAPAAAEFRARLEAWLILELRGDQAAADRVAHAALALQLPNREGSMNLPLLEALTAAPDALPRLAEHPFEPVAMVARARQAELVSRFDDAASMWRAAIAASLDDRYSHLLRVYLARALVSAGRSAEGREVCELEATPHSIHWAAFPARAECLLLQATTLLDEHDVAGATEKLERLKRTRVLAPTDPVTMRLRVLEKRAHEP